MRLRRVPALLQRLDYPSLVKHSAVGVDRFRNPIAENGRVMAQRLKDVCKLRGIDGRIYPVSDVTKKAGRKSGDFDFMDEWYPVQVKRESKTDRPDIDAFETAMQREGRKKGFFVSFEYTGGALREIDGFFKRTGCVIVPLTVREILDEEIAKKLA